MWIPTKLWSARPSDHGCTVSALFVIVHFIGHAASVASLQTVSGVLYAENFTYYKLSGQGWLHLELQSLEGDVDLYVSGLTLHPSFSDYELKSDSCGLDTVDIHSFMTRPVGIAIYAHPFYMQSAFKLTIQVVKEFEIDEYERLFLALHYYSDDDEANTKYDRIRNNIHTNFQDDRTEEVPESIWWTILLTVLKFVLEIIV